MMSVMDPRQAALEFVAEVETLFGERLESIVLYGSVPRHEAVLGASDINLIVILDRVSVEDLERLAPVTRRWVSSGRATPMLFGAEEFRRSSDAFAMEMADMLDRREILFGRDPVAGLEVNLPAMRHQLEHEMRARRTQLREGMLVTAQDPGSVGDLLLRAIPAYVCYLRAILRLADRDISDSSEDVIRAAANVVDAAPEAFLSVWSWRKAGATPALRLTDPVVKGYDALVDQAIAWVDALALN